MYIIVIKIKENKNMISIINKFSKGFILGFILWAFFSLIYIVYNENKKSEEANDLNKSNSLIIDN